MSYTSNVISRPEDFYSLRDTWEAVSSADPATSLCMTHAWLSCWLDIYWQPGYQLRILVVRNIDKQPICIVPLYFNPDRNVYYALGTGEPEISEVASEYVDLIVISGVLDYDALYDFIAADLRSLQVRIVWPNTLADSHVCRVTNRFRLVSYQLTGRQFQIDLALSYASIEQAFSSNMRKKCRLLMNRFSKRKSLEFSILPGNEFDRLWDTLRVLHQDNWQSRGKPGAFYSEEFNRFHHCMHQLFTQTMKEPDQLFSVLHCDGEIIAINFYYTFRDVIHFYQSGVVKDRYRNLSPGIMLHALTISTLAGKGSEHRFYDFMKGGTSYNYKNSFTTPEKEFYTVTLYGKGPVDFITWIKSKLKSVLFKRTKKSPG